MSLVKAFKWLLIDQFTLSFGDGDGGSPGPSTTNVQNSNLPTYVEPYVTSMLGAAQQQMFNMNGNQITGFKPYTPYSTNMNDYVAGFSPLQQQAQTSAAGLQTPGQFQAGSQLAGAAGLGSLGTAGNVANTGANYYGMATSPTATQAFMNPYIQASLTPQLEEMRRQYGITGTQQAGQATAAGAFGGSRDALMASENKRNMNMAMNQAIGSGYDKAFQAAQQAQQFGANLGLQGQQAALQGYGQAGQAGSTLGQLGTAQLGAQQGIINTQNTAGNAQQTQEQNKINQAIQNYAQQQQMPLQSLSNLSGLLHGLPLQNTTTQSYQAAPSTISQIAGLGTGIAGISKLAAEGGVMKSYAGGGITSLENRQRIAGNYSPQMLQQSVQRGVLPQGIGGVLSQDYTNMANRAQQGQAAQQVAERAAQAAAAVPDEANGVSGLPSNLPLRMAQGGIIAFAEGDVVKTSKRTVTRDPLHWDYTPTAPDYTEADTMITAAEAAPHTMDAVANARTAEEQKRGITDVYTPMLNDLKAKEAALAGKQDRAQGLALLAAGAKMMGSTSPYAGVGIGAGIGEYATNYGAASEKLDALKENYSQQNNNIMLAQNAYKEAALTNDTNRMDKAKSTIIAAQQNKQKLKEDFAKTVDTGNLKKAEKTADYYKDVSVEGMKASNARITDMRNGIDIIYNSLTQPGPNGEPPKMAPGPQAKATALKQYQEQTGMSLEKLMLAKELGVGKLNEDQKKTYANLTAKDSGYQILQTRLNIMKESDPKYAELKAKSDEIEKKHMTTALGGGSNTSTDTVQSPNKFLLDGFSFPDQKSMDAYKKAKESS